jgi:SAM-dependent methyltransferase
VIYIKDDHVKLGTYNIINDQLSATMTKMWFTFWRNYGPETVLTEEDLYKQVGLTIGKKPIGKDLFEKIVNHIRFLLDLSRKDELLDLCCGNGLISYELAENIDKLIGIDFVPHNIHTAIEHKSRNNIKYFVGDVVTPLHNLIGTNEFPNKYLMNGSLSYFEPKEFEIILRNIIEHMCDKPFEFLLTAVPNYDLKWNFYNTPERVMKHIENETKIWNANDGLGRWWRPEEVFEVCSFFGIRPIIRNQKPGLSNYRMDILIKYP